MEDAVAPRRLSADSAARNERYRVVIADDSEPMRVLLRTLVALESDLECVGEAHDGVVALEVVERESPDVLLLDVAMPRLGGLDVLDRLAQTHPLLPVVVFSSYSDGAVQAAAFARGATDYIVKGAAPSDVIGRLRRACAQRAAAA